MIIDPQLAPQQRLGDNQQTANQLNPHVVRRSRVVDSPHHHRDAARLAFGDPAQFVLVIPVSHPSCLTQVTSVCHHHSLDAKKGPEGPFRSLAGIMGQSAETSMLGGTMTASIT